MSLAFGSVKVDLAFGAEYMSLAFGSVKVDLAFGVREPRLRLGALAGFAHARVNLAFGSGSLRALLVLG